jgi:hypothetical protein
MTKYKCDKRPIFIDLEGYCDWFEKKRKTLTKKCCRNCRYIHDGQFQKTEDEKTIKKTKKKKQDEG